MRPGCTEVAFQPSLWSDVAWPAKYLYPDLEYPSGLEAISSEHWRWQRVTMVKMWTTSYSSFTKEFTRKPACDQFLSGGAVAWEEQHIIDSAVYEFREHDRFM